MCRCGSRSEMAITTTAAIQYARNILSSNRIMSWPNPSRSVGVDRLFAKLTNDGAADELFCYFVIFSKVSSAVPAFHELINLVNNGARYPRCRIIFGTAGVDWPTVPRHGLCER